MIILPAIVLVFETNVATRHWKLPNWIESNVLMPTCPTYNFIGTIAICFRLEVPSLIGKHKSRYSNQQIIHVSAKVSDVPGSNVIPGDTKHNQNLTERGNAQSKNVKCLKAIGQKKTR